MQAEELREFLVQHARHPHRTGDLKSANGIGECRNPICGDHVKVSLHVEDEKIQQMRILPTGCSIAIASASLMTDMIEGQELAQTEKMLKLAIQTFAANAKEEWPQELNQLKPLERMRENPTKVPCALMGWFALKDAIKNYKTREGLL